ncbi:MAG TPA: phosphopantetheine-binding protein [Longimicrobium sp.]|nr:phosphopantetheine-binding protein [Longimicrobium sp.]
MDEITRSVLEVARGLADPEDAAALDGPDAELAAAGFGSLKTVGLLMELESRFAIRFPADAIDAETFRSVRSVAGRVRTLLAPE